MLRMMLNIQNGVRSGRDVLLPFTRMNKFDFEGYFVISSAGMEAVELNIEKFLDVSGASLCETLQPECGTLGNLL